MPPKHALEDAIAALSERLDVVAASWDQRHDSFIAVLSDIQLQLSSRLALLPAPMYPGFSPGPSVLPPPPASPPPLFLSLSHLNFNCRPLMGLHPRLALSSRAIFRLLSDSVEPAPSHGCSFQASPTTALSPSFKGSSNGSAIGSLAYHRRWSLIVLSLVSVRTYSGSSLCCSLLPSVRLSGSPNLWKLNSWTRGPHELLLHRYHCGLPHCCPRHHSSCHFLSVVCPLLKCSNVGPRAFVSITTTNSDRVTFARPSKFLLLLATDSEPPEPPDTLIDDASEALAPLPPPLRFLTPDAAPDGIHFQLSSTAVSGSLGSRTLCLHGLVHEHSFSVLIDSGSSHNIIQPRVAAYLGLTVTPLSVFPVMVDNGASLHCSGVCHVVPLLLQSHLFQVPLFVILIYGADIVLGVQWLSTLGPFISEFSVPSMQFYHGDHLITLFGDPSTTPQGLNAIMLRDRFPIPTVDQFLDELHGASVFSKIDICTGYHQIRVAPADVHKTAFCTVDGHFDFLVMPFGLSNAPATFQAVMNYLFRPYLRHFVLVFFDDILIYSPTWNSHLTHLTTVLQVLQDNCFFAKLSKCLFGVTSVDYLGHVVSAAGISADHDKLQVVADCAPPVSFTSLRAFLGLTGYYRRFVRHYASLAGPLTDLLKHRVCQWTPAAATAFERLKRAMVSLPVLRLLDFSLPFDVTTDAS
ncbi:UNVERIFIED_CONTAM: Retrovirus-related Pol polyprotein from transposon [Sesamum radiatum]|uniref:Retrovirus-related Pol polyprotein from transposon n=1 Tax=Sesamum radiatum TaxID=300843 RepID=A0AAW2V2L5_SESRA